MRESEWYSIKVCSECENRLTGSQVMYGGGVCPICGHDSDGTVCKTNKIILKEIKHHKWWQIWKRKFTYIGKNEYSKNWINKH